MLLFYLLVFIHLKQKQITPPVIPNGITIGAAVTTTTGSPSVFLKYQQHMTLGEKKREFIHSFSSHT